MDQIKPDFKDKQSSQIPAMAGAVCPIPLTHSDRIVMGHGSGGKMAHELIKRVFQPYFENPSLNTGDDAAILPVSTGSRLAISTDSHVVWPLFFPGGDIGRLAVCGTVNDVAVMGAQPLFLTAGFILEEGLEVEVLHQVLASMQTAAEEAGVKIVAGDTKVVQKGKADGVYINTTGVGQIPPETNIHGANAQPGDSVIISGSIGDHGIAVLQARGELGFSSEIKSDVSPLNKMIAELLQSGLRVHVMRDPTRGGLATTLNEIARQSQVGIHLEEKAIPIHKEVASACEMLGFDPLYIANEGKVICIVAPEDADLVLECLHNHPYGREAARIGEVRESPPGRVLVRTAIGSQRIVDMLSGEILPRIC